VGDLSGFFNTFGWLPVALVTYAILAGLGWLVGLVTGGGKPDLMRSYGERLADYPPATGFPGRKRLTLEGLPVRVRLVVLAPIGKQELDVVNAEAILDSIVRGLGLTAGKDKPRVRIWPPQLSNVGFAPTFHRLVVSPDADRAQSRWIKVAGQARAGQRPVLVGLALYADEPTDKGELILQPDQWPEFFRVQTVDADGDE
jgi:hypothetical protein